MSETKIELIENSCACSAEGGQCCSDNEVKVEEKAEGSCCSDNEAIVEEKAEASCCSQA